MKTETRELRLTVEMGSDFDALLPRELGPAVMSGASGLRVEGPRVRAELRLRGPLRVETERVEEGRTRVRWWSEATEMEAVRVGVPRVEVEEGEGDDELALALAEGHPLQWWRVLAGEVGSARWSRAARWCGMAPWELEEVQRIWARLGARVEAVVYRAWRQGEWRRLVEFCEGVVEAARTELGPKEKRWQRERSFGESVEGRWWSAVRTGAEWGEMGEEEKDRVREAGRQIVELGALPVAQVGRVFELRRRRAEGQEVEVGRGSEKEDLRGEAAEVMERARRLRRGVGEKLEGALRVRLAEEVGRLARETGLPLVEVETGSEEEAERMRAGEMGELKWEQLGMGLLTHYLRPVGVEVLGVMGTFRAREANAEGRWTVERDEAGRLYVGPGGADLEQLALWGATYAGAVRSRCQSPVGDNVRLVGTGTTLLGNALAEKLWQRLVGEYGFERQALVGARRVSLTLAVPAAAAEHWGQSPHSREREYVPALCRVSRTVQKTLRGWMAALHFDGAERLGTPSVARPLLVYHCAGAYTRARKGEVIGDYMDREVMERILQTAGRGLERVVPAAGRTLEAAGRERCAKLFAPKTMRSFVQAVRRQPRQLLTLLVAEAQMVEDLVQLADEARELRSGYGSEQRETVRDVRRYAEAAAQSVERRLRHLLPRQDLRGLGGLMLVAATGALAERVGGESVLTATLRVESDDGVAVYESRPERSEEEAE